MLYSELEPVPKGAESQSGAGEKYKEKGRQLGWARHQALRSRTCCRCPGPSEVHLGGPGERGSVPLGPRPLPPGRGSRGRRQYLAQPTEGYVEGQGEEVLHQLFKSFGQVLELLFLQAEPQQNPSCNAES